MCFNLVGRHANRAQIEILALALVPDTRFHRLPPASAVVTHRLRSVGDAVQVLGYHACSATKFLAGKSTAVEDISGPIE